MKKCAVILCGSGYMDGSEIRESVGTLLALSQEGAETHFFAPNAPQADVIDCLNNKTLSEKRNMLIEAARIARGKIQSLAELNVDDFNALIIPGGFGVAKNLCSFATDGSNAKVLPEMKNILQKFHAARKPIGAICIAPALVALTFPQKGFELTVGPKSEASQEIEKLGHKHIVCAANGCHIDFSARIATTPAYMLEKAPVHEIFIGIHKLVKEVLKLCA